MACACKPSTEEVATEEAPGLLPVSLTKQTSSRFRGRPCLKNCGGDWNRETLDVDFWSSQTHTRAHLHRYHTDTRKRSEHTGERAVKKCVFSTWETVSQTCVGPSYFSKAKSLSLQKDKQGLSRWKHFRRAFLVNRTVSAKVTRMGRRHICACGWVVVGCGFNLLQRA